MAEHTETRVVVAGGGVAALEAALALRELADERVSLELLAPEPRFWYRPLAVAAPFALGAVRHYDLADIAERIGAAFTLGALASVDVRAHEARTAAGSVVPYDVLLIACGAVPKVAVHGALTFRGPADTDRIERLLEEIEAGAVEQVAFVVPWGAVWSLPAYELALMTSAWLHAHELHGVRVALVTPEEAPLRLFGAEASTAIRRLLDERGVAVRTRAIATNFRDGRLVLLGGGELEADRAVALPSLHGQRIDGIPQERDLFVAVDSHGRVAGCPDVYAAGDITTFPVKQGGLAAQQADAAARAIAAAAGAPVTATEFRPVLRGLLLTGAEPRYLRGDGRPGVGGSVSPEPLWWPPAKVAGRYLAPFLSALTGIDLPDEPDGLHVETELDPEPSLGIGLGF